MKENFDGYYQRILHQEAMKNWPPALTDAYQPISCITTNEKGGIFVVSRASDGAKGILRISIQKGAEHAKAEYDILSRLDDPRIPKALFYVEADGVSYLVRTYMEGQTLKEYVEAHGAVSEKELIAIACEICSILIYLHHQEPPVIHRDIKPENIIIAPDGMIQLVDFGIARTHRFDATSDTVAIGTRPYMAPEQFGGAQTDQRSDLYALGVVMIYLATLRHDRTNIGKRFPYPNLSGIIVRLTRSDPEDRFRTAEELLSALRRAQRSGWRFWLKVAAALMAVGAIALLSLWVGRQTGIRSGEQAGRDAGIQEGILQGMETGRMAGYEEGLADAGRLQWQGKDILAHTLFQPDETNGAGNLVMGGIATADGDTVYFTHRGKIYRQSADGSITLFYETFSRMLQVYEDALYFIGTNGIYRINLSDSQFSMVLRCFPQELWVDNGRLYYTNQLDQLNLYSAMLDGSQNQRCEDIIRCNYATIQDGWILGCSAGGANGERVLTKQPIRQPDAPGEPSSKSESSVYIGSTAQKPIVLSYYDANWLNVTNNHLYYIAYTPEGSFLASCNMNGGYTRLYDWVLARKINVSPYGIFYVESTSGKTIRLSLDGMDQHRYPTVRMENFSVVAGWVYYKNRDDQSSLYRMRVDGTGNEKIDDMRLP